MIKKYEDAAPEKTTVASESAATYEARSRYHAPAKDASTRERIMASSVSVDEYFDELVSLVHKDYANL